MMKGWYPRQRAILLYLERGEISLLDSAVHDVLSLWADHKTGVCSASAEKLRVLCPAGVSGKSIQRSLEKLERLGWIKRWIVRGRKGNYPILVCRYLVRDASMTWRATSCEKTSDFRNVQFDDVHDPSLNRPRVVLQDVREESFEVSTVQEVRLSPSALEVRSDGRENRDMSQNPRDAAAPSVPSEEIPEIVQRLGHRELKGLKTNLERTLRDHRMPEVFREQVRKQLLQVVSVFQKKYGVNPNSK